MKSFYCILFVSRILFLDLFFNKTNPKIVKVVDNIVNTNTTGDTKIMKSVNTHEIMQRTILEFLK